MGLYNLKSPLLRLFTGQSQAQKSVLLYQFNVNQYISLLHFVNIFVLFSSLPQP